MKRTQVEETSIYDLSNSINISIIIHHNYANNNGNEGNDIASYIKDNNYKNVDDDNYNHVNDNEVK